MQWPAILVSMARIAEGDGREAVQAARFLAEQKERLEEEADHQEEKGQSLAAVLLRKAREGPQTVRARRTTVKEEIQVAN